MKKFWLQVAGLLILIFGGIALSLNPQSFFGAINPVTTSPKPTVSNAINQLSIVDGQASGTFDQPAIPKVLITAEIVDTLEKRQLGLGGRSNLPETSGMLFVFDNPGTYRFWMKGMQFPLDFIWISQNKVVDITQKVPSPTAGQQDKDLPVFGPSTMVDSMLEVNAGFVEKYNLKVGDLIEEVR